MKTCPLFCITANQKESFFTNCLREKCMWWIGDDYGCGVCPIPTVVYKEKKDMSQFIPQLKRNIEILLQEKTGWGRVTLMKRLIEVIDNTESFAPSVGTEEDIPF